MKVDIARSFGPLVFVAVSLLAGCEAGPESCEDPESFFAARIDGAIWLECTPAAARFWNAIDETSELFMTSDERGVVRRRGDRPSLQFAFEVPYEAGADLSARIDDVDLLIGFEFIDADGAASTAVDGHLDIVHDSDGHLKGEFGFELDNGVMLDEGTFSVEVGNYY